MLGPTAIEDVVWVNVGRYTIIVSRAKINGVKLCVFILYKVELASICQVNTDQYYALCA